MSPRALLRFSGIATTGLCLSFVGPLLATDFKEDVQPILKEKCFKCHSGPQAKNGLRYDVAEKFAERVGGEDPVVVPGKPEESLMVELAKRMLDDPSDPDGMPPARRGVPLNATELSILSSWIAEGASFEEGGAKMTSAEGSAEGGAVAAADQKHTWTSTEGKTIQAGFIRLEGEAVVLKLEDGREYPLPLTRLSAESQALAKKLGGAAQ